MHLSSISARPPRGAGALRAEQGSLGGQSSPGEVEQGPGMLRASGKGWLLTSECGRVVGTDTSLERPEHSPLLSLCAAAAQSGHFRHFLQLGAGLSALLCLPAGTCIWNYINPVLSSELRLSQHWLDPDTEIPEMSEWGPALRACPEFKWPPALSALSAAFQSSWAHPGQLSSLPEPSVTTSRLLPASCALRIHRNKAQILS